MSDNELQNLLDYLNSGESTKIVHAKSLTKHVKYGNIWEEKPHDNSQFYSEKGFKSFYFINNLSGKYIGIIYIMEDGLHWYLNEESRGKGLMTYVVKDIVIPHQLNFNQIIKITIDPEKSDFAEKSKNVAMKAGFKQHKEGYYYFSKRFHNYTIKSFLSTEELSLDRYHELHLEVNSLSKRFNFIKSELVMRKCDSNLLKSLDEVIKSIAKLSSQLW